MPETVLTDEQIEAILPQLNVAWSDIPGQGLVRVFDTGTFRRSMALVNRIAEVAEAQNHHPDIHITYHEVELTLSTHSVGGVTKRDVDLATAIDKLADD